jgi:hypothetical protein
MPEKYRQSYAERNALLGDLDRIYRYGEERELMQLLRKHGIKDEDSRFVETVKTFRDLRAGKT